MRSKLSVEHGPRYLNLCHGLDQEVFIYNYISSNLSSLSNQILTPPQLLCNSCSIYSGNLVYRTRPGGRSTSPSSHLSDCKGVYILPMPHNFHLFCNDAKSKIKGREHLDTFGRCLFLPACLPSLSPCRPPSRAPPPPTHWVQSDPTR